MSGVTLSLTVSHLPTACSFYLSALHPLGFHYICDDDGCVGLGSKGPSLFLCQGPPKFVLLHKQSKGIINIRFCSQVARTRIVFSAEDRISVRDVYAAALDAGAIPSQPPEYRNFDTGEFGAAVFDFDGNVIEAVCPGDVPPSAGPEAPKNGSILTWSQDVANQSAPPPSYVAARAATNDVKSTASVAKSVASQNAPGAESAAPSKASHISAAKSRTSTAPARSATEGDKVGQNLATTLLGAAAGAAIAYGWSKVDSERWKKESDDAKAEAEEHFAKKERSVRDGKSERRRSASVEPTRSVARTQTYPFLEVPPSRSRSLRSAKVPASRSGRGSYRDPTTVGISESERSRRSTRAIEAPPPKSVRSQSATRSIRAIEAAPSRFGESRSAVRSAQPDETGKPPRSSLKNRESPTVLSTKTGKSTRITKTARTPKDEKAPTEVRSHREMAPHQDDPSPTPRRNRSITLPASGLAGVSEMVKGMHSAYERANQLYNDFQMTASGIPLPASRANSDSGGSRRGSAADIPLLASKAGSRASRRSEYYSAADLPLPASKAGSRMSRRSEYHSAAGVPLPASRLNSSAESRSHVSGMREKAKYPADAEIELPGSGKEKILDDLETLAPDDSASQISSPPPSPRMPRHSPHLRRPRYSDFRRNSGRGRDGYEYIIRPYAISETSESTIKPGRKHGRRDSGISLPVRPRRRISFGKSKGSAVHSAY